MNIKKWFNQKLGILSLALSNVEKNALTQTGEGLSADVNQTMRLSQGKLSDSLVNGEITQEVMNLKWRTYKILRATEGLTAEIVGYDADGMPITKVKKRNTKKGLKKVILDEIDNFPLEMVVDNSEISTSSNDAMSNVYISVLDQVSMNLDADGSIISATHGTINGTEYFASNKSEKPIKIERDFVSNFKIEDYTLKLNVRKINKKQRLLEFCVSIYPDEYKRTSRLFLSALKKAIENPTQANMLDIKDVSFVSYKTMGVSDYLEYEYKITSFDKIIEFNGNYIIKFIADVSIDGRDILEEHRVEALDKKYADKAKK